MSIHINNTITIKYNNSNKYIYRVIRKPTCVTLHMHIYKSVIMSIHTINKKKKFSHLLIQPSLQCILL